MSNKNNTIEINGKQYDAETGEASVAHASNAKAPSKSPHKAVIRHVARYTVRHQPLSSKILMRKAVKKPGPSLKRQVKAQGQLGLEKHPLANLTDEPKASVGLMQRARLVPKSESISHFTPGTALAPGNFSSNVASGTNSRRGHGLEATSSPTHEQNRPETTSEFLDRAVREATSHERKPIKSPAHSHIKRHPNIIAAAVIAVTLISVVSAHSLTGAQLQTASASAGFSAKLPDYKPSGFSQGQFEYSPGVVSTDFNSNSDGRNYAITQKASTMDSPTLRDTFVAPNDAHFETITSENRTIYIYGNHNATWVNSGVWYIVQANGSLSDRQLVELASSL